MDQSPEAPSAASTAAAPPSRLRRGARAVALNGGLALLSLGLAAGLAEVAVRLVAPQQLILIRPDLWQPADTVGWLHRPNVSITLNTGERTVSVYTDSAGFRVGAGGPARDGVPVLILGDSFMEALQVEHEQSFPGLLQEGLTAVLGKPVAIRNAGMAGWGPGQYAARAAALLPTDSFGLVITSIYLGNDVPAERRDYVPPRPHAERHHFRFPRRLSGSELTRAILSPINDFLEVRSHLFVLVRSRLETVRMRMGLAPLTFPPQYLASQAGSPRWAVTVGLCESINALAERRGARALFLLIPAPFQVDSASLARYLSGFDVDPGTVALDQPNRLLAEGLAARRIRVLDLADAFRAAHDSGVQVFGTVDPHLSPEGHRLLTRLVTPVAAELLGGRP